MNQWFDNLIIDAFIHLSTMQPTKPKNPVIMQTWARYSHRSTYSSMHAHVRALIYSIMRFNIHSCMHSCKERSPQSSHQSQSTMIYRDLQYECVWCLFLFVPSCLILWDFALWAPQFVHCRRCASSARSRTGNKGAASMRPQDITRLWTWTDMDELCSNYAIIDHNCI